MLMASVLLQAEIEKVQKRREEKQAEKERMEEELVSRTAAAGCVLCCAVQHLLNLSSTQFVLRLLIPLFGGCSVLMLGRRFSLSPPSVSICITRVMGQSHQTLFVPPVNMNLTCSKVHRLPTEACCCLPIYITGHAAAAAACSRGCGAGTEGRGVPLAAGTGEARRLRASSSRV
jgi:hypothetical protein